jgi:hypothetical protein
MNPSLLKRFSCALGQFVTDLLLGVVLPLIFFFSMFWKWRSLVDLSQTRYPDMTRFDVGWVAFRTVVEPIRVYFFYAPLHAGEAFRVGQVSLVPYALDGD